MKARSLGRKLACRVEFSAVVGVGVWSCSIVGNGLGAFDLGLL